MSSNDRSSSTPNEGTPFGSTPTGHASDQWIMKSLNDLRDDMKDLKASISGHDAKSTLAHGELKGLVSSVDNRLQAVEGRMNKAIFASMGAVGAIVFLTAFFTFFGNFFDISITPKAEASSQAAPVAE